MILDSFQEIDLIENADLPGGGLPVYIVADNKPRKAKIKFFRGETAYADAQRYMNDQINARVYGGK